MPPRKPNKNRTNAPEAEAVSNTEQDTAGDTVTVGEQDPSTEATNTQENSTMTDTATFDPDQLDEQPAEVTSDENDGQTVEVPSEDEQPPATEPEATEAPAAPAKSAEEKEAEHQAAQETLTSAVETALENAEEDGTLTDEDIESLRLAYKGIHASKRAQVQADIMRAQLTREGVNSVAVANVLEEMVQAPTSKAAKTPRETKPARPLNEVVGEQLAVLEVARQAILADNAEVASDAESFAANFVGSTIEDEAEREAFVKRVALVVGKTTTKARSTGGGGGGDRKTYTESVSDLLSRGDLVAGDVLAGGKDNAYLATVLEDGTIRIDQGNDVGTTHKSPSTAASKASGAASLNGWGYWTVQRTGKALGDLRQA